MSYCKSILLLVFLVPTWFLAHDLNLSDKQNKPIVIITASYNNRDWFKWNLDSIFNQTYENWHVIYIDDCSPDGTGDLVESYVNSRNMAHKVTIIKNGQRRGAMANQYSAIHTLGDSVVCVIVDGDDRLANAHVLTKVNELYHDSNVWLTFGQYVEYPKGLKGFCHAYPNEVIENNSFRSYQDIPSHLRTFYAGLFKKIKIEDLMYDGYFLLMCADIAAMIPMIEMAGSHHKFVPDVLLEYNGANTLNDHKISKKLQRMMDLHVRSLPRYTAIESPY